MKATSEAIAKRTERAHVDFHLHRKNGSISMIDAAQSYDKHGTTTAVVVALKDGSIIRCALTPGRDVEPCPCAVGGGVMKLPRSPQSLASSSPHRWSGLIPVIVTTGEAAAVDGAILLNVSRQIVSLDGTWVRLPRTMFLIFAAVACSGRRLSISEIAEFVWGDDEDGGPDSAEISIRTQMSRIRELIEPLGLGIASWHSWGYQVCRLQDQRRAGKPERVTEAA